uniref:Uncharacterized protein n=1 Tax=Cacopsylla melanoneura TaxID=428564 RepID=A0A8D8QZ99_9HEMI
MPWQTFQSYIGSTHRYINSFIFRGNNFTSGLQNFLRRCGCGVWDCGCNKKTMFVLRVIYVSLIFKSKKLVVIPQGLLSDHTLFRGESFDNGKVEISFANSSSMLFRNEQEFRGFV